MLSNAKIEKCGYFCYSLDNKYGCSPDGLGPAGILLEVKTRAARSTGPITSLDNFPQYYIVPTTDVMYGCRFLYFAIIPS